MLNALNVHVSDILNEHGLKNQILTSFNFMCKKINNHLSLYVLKMLDMRSFIKFILSGLKESDKSLFLKEYCQGKRMEIGPIKSFGFGEYNYQNYMLIYGNVIFTWNMSECIKKDRLFICIDSDNILKINTILKDKTNWDITNLKSSISIDSLKNKLIQVL